MSLAYARSNYAIEVIRREQIGQVCCEWIYRMWFKWTLKADVTPFCSLFTFWRRRSQKSNACASWEPIYTTSSVRCHLFTKNSARLQKNVSNSYTCTLYSLQSKPLPSMLTWDSHNRSYALYVSYVGIWVLLELHVAYRMSRLQ